MKILGFNGGSYNVEYIPEKDGCKPIKLNIQIDQDSLRDEDRIISLLKASSPQEYWYNQIIAHESGNINQIAQSLISREYDVSEYVPLPTNPVNSFSFHPTNLVNNGPRVEAVPAPPPRPGQASNTGSSTPEQVANPEDQNIIKLKILIQQVIQEMADGTV